MSFSQLFFMCLLFSCSISFVFSQDEFSQFERDIFLNHTVLGKIPDNEENETYLKLNKEGIKVYVYSHKNSEFETFKASTHILAG